MLCYLSLNDFRILQWFSHSCSTFSSCRLCHSSPFAPIIIITVPRGHHPTINMNMSRTKLVVQMTYLTVFLMRMGQRTHIFCGHTVFKLQQCTWTRTEWKWRAHPRHTNTHILTVDIYHVCSVCPRLMRLHPSPAQTLPLFPGLCSMRSHLSFFDEVKCGQPSVWPLTGWRLQLTWSVWENVCSFTYFFLLYHLLPSWWSREIDATGTWLLE